MSVFEIFDEKVLLFVYNYLHFPFLDRLMLFITSLGDHAFIWIVSAFFLLISKKTRKIGIMVLLSIILSTIIGNHILKPLFGRLRPFYSYTDIPLLLPSPSGFSFPSGHTITSFASAAAIYLYNQHWGRWALFLAALIGFSRIYLFVHYPTDVLAGMIFGSIIAYLTVQVVEKCIDHAVKD